MRNARIDWTIFGCTVENRLMAPSFDESAASSWRASLSCFNCMTRWNRLPSPDANRSLATRGSCAQTLSLMPLIPVSINNSPETGVVVVGVVTVVGPLARSAANNAPSEAIVRARRRDGVLVIVAPPVRWQYLLEITE